MVQVLGLAVHDVAPVDGLLHRPAREHEQPGALAAGPERDPDAAVEGVRKPEAQLPRLGDDARGVGGQRHLLQRDDVVLAEQVAREQHLQPLRHERSHGDEAGVERRDAQLLRGRGHILRRCRPLPRDLAREQLVRVRAAGRCAAVSAEALPDARAARRREQRRHQPEDAGQHDGWEHACVAERGR